MPGTSRNTRRFAGLFFGPSRIRSRITPSYPGTSSGRAPAGQSSNSSSG
jgi:hypothetical protein